MQLGAKVFLTAAGIRQRADVFSGGSYGSSSDQRVHFGLGSATKVDKIEIDWPSGVKQQIGAQPVDRVITVEEGKPVSEASEYAPASCRLITKASPPSDVRALRDHNFARRAGEAPLYPAAGQACRGLGNRALRDV